MAVTDLNLTSTFYTIFNNYAFLKDSYLYNRFLTTLFCKGYAIFNRL